MRRRDAITCVASWASIAAVLPRESLKAQQPSPMRRIGLLSPAAPTVTWIADSLRRGLTELGYVEGQTIQSSTAAGTGRLIVCQGY